MMVIIHSTTTYLYSVVDVCSSVLSTPTKRDDLSAALAV